jgi:hypothetical protein
MRISVGEGEPGGESLAAGPMLRTYSPITVTTTINAVLIPFSASATLTGQIKTLLEFEGLGA